MNANRAFAASAGVSPDDEMRQGTPALDASDSRAPEPTRERDRARAAVTSLETFLTASAFAEPLQSKVALARLSTSIASRLTRAVPVLQSRPSRGSHNLDGAGKLPAVALRNCEHASLSHCGVAPVVTHGKVGAANAIGVAQGAAYEDEALVQFEP